MNPEIPQLLIILREACEKFGYSWRLTDTYSNSLAEVSNGKKGFFSSNNGKLGIYPINSQFSSQITKDKGWCYMILKEKGYKIPLGDYFFLKDEYRELRGDKKELKDGLNFAKKIGYPVFVKPNDSSQGTLAEIIEDQKELKRHLTAISQISNIALIQEVINQPEYRIFVVEGEVQFAYQRTHGKIIGDGKSTIQDLLQKLKMERASNAFSFLRKKLKKNHLTFDSVLPKNQEIQITSPSNLAAGGQIKNYTEKVSPETERWIKGLMKTLAIKVAGIDIFASGSIDDPNGFTIIEVNSNPSLEGIYNMGKKEKAMEILGKILKAYFGWQKSDRNITKIFTFKHFKETMNFVNQVADLAEEMNHHPDILIHDYKKVTLRLTTHSTGKVTEKDIELAEKIDSIFNMWIKSNNKPLNSFKFPS